MIYLRQFVILFFIISISYSQDIRINEVSSSNSMFYDEDGDTPDWIELYNNSNILHTFYFYYQSKSKKGNEIFFIFYRFTNNYFIDLKS